MAGRARDGGAGVVGVVGARGGAGASVVASLLAARLARRGPTALVDAGPGPSLDTLLGLEEHPGLRWPDLGGAVGRVDPALLAGNLVRWAGCGVLATDDGRPGPPPASVVPDVLEALAAAHRSVVLDLHRAAVLGRTDPDLVTACRTVLVVVPRDVPGVAGARLLRAAVVGDGRRAGLVVRAPAPGGLGVDEVGAAVGLPVVAALPWARGLGAAVDHGAGPAAGTVLARAVERLAARVADGTAGSR
jgi:secretion/DNA translocation related CpaE-like protein